MSRLYWEAMVSRNVQRQLEAEARRPEPPSPDFMATVDAEIKAAYERRVEAVPETARPMNAATLKLLERVLGMELPAAARPEAIQAQFDRLRRQLEEGFARTSDLAKRYAGKKV